jgi:hypothetical protein
MNCLYAQETQTEDVTPTPDYTAVWTVLVSIQSAVPMIRSASIYEYAQNAHSYFQL